MSLLTWQRPVSRPWMAGPGPALLCLLLTAAGVGMQAEQWLRQSATGPQVPVAQEAGMAPLPAAGEALYDEVRYFSDLARPAGLAPD